MKYFEEYFKEFAIDYDVHKTEVDHWIRILTSNGQVCYFEHNSLNVSGLL